LILALLLFVSLILYTFLLYASYFIDLNLCSDGEKERERERERIYYKETDILVFVQSGFMELRKKKMKKLYDYCIFCATCCTGNYIYNL